MSPLFKHHFLLIGFFGALFTYLFLAYPFLQGTFTEESRFIERLTVIAYFLSFAVAWIAVKKTTQRVVRHHGIFISVISLVWFLEETSFGHSFFYDYQRPRFYNIKVDALHDVVEVGLRMLSENAKGFEATFLYSFVLALTAVGLLFAWQNAGALWRFFTSTPGIFIIIGSVWLVLASVVDIYAPRGYPVLIFAEELLELFTAVAVVYAAWALFQKHFTIQEKKP